METQNLRKALDMLMILRYNSDDFWAVLHDAEYSTEETHEVLQAMQKELNELQRLSEVVKGFIEDYGITCRSELKTIDHDEALDLMVDICDIVGYHKE